MIRYFVQRIFARFRRMIAARKGSSSYWSVHMVAHEEFHSPEQSLNHFHWRNAQYPGYIELMPVSEQDGKVVLDYGCGPGNDLVGFTEMSRTKELYGLDVSGPALELAKSRLTLHGGKIEYVQVEETSNEIPLPSESVDYIHSSGVLHHCQNLESILSEFDRILKPDGEVSVMVYNYNSIWLHLYVAYVWQLERRKYADIPIEDAFRCSTDGEDCPISKCYMFDQFTEIFRSAGFKCEHKGASISLTELKLLDRRYDAIGDKRLSREHRDFLSSLTFDNRGTPLYLGEVAGINGCYKFRKAAQ